MKWTTSLPRLPLNPTTMSSRGWVLTLDVILMSMGLNCKELQVITLTMIYVWWILCNKCTYMFALIVIEMRISVRISYIIILYICHIYIYMYDIMLDNYMMGLYTASIYFLVHRWQYLCSPFFGQALISNLLDPRNEPCTLDITFI